MIAPTRVARSIAACASASLVASAASSASAGQSEPSASFRAVLVTYPCVDTNFFCQPFRRALRSTGVSGRIVSPDPREDAVTTLSLLAREHELVVVDFDWTAALERVAPSFPKTQFAIPDVLLSQIRGRPRNVEALFVRTHEASYLAGWLVLPSRTSSSASGQASRPLRGGPRSSSGRGGGRSSSRLPTALPGWDASARR